MLPFRKSPSGIAMPSKYRKFTSYLASLDRSPRTLQFKEIEAVLGFALPRSAFSYPAWWSNQSGGGHSQNLAWRLIGWRTANLNLAEQRVTFVRDGNEPDDKLIDIGHVHSVLARLEKSRQASAEPSPVLTITALPDSIEPTAVITNKELWDAIFRAATRDLEDFVKRYAELRQQQPMLEEVSEKVEEAIRRLRGGRVVHRRPGSRSAENPS